MASRATDHDRGEPYLSALVVARNEEKSLPACLSSLDFTDEIVVVLDRCTDGSRAIAERAGARIVEGEWPREGPRRHAGIDAARGPWILELDADERVSPALAAEIRAAIKNDNADIYLIPFENYIGAKKIRHGWGAYNGVAAKNCLFRKGSKVWGPERVHPAVKYSGRRARLNHSIEHYVDDDLTDFFNRLNRDSEKAACDLAEKGTLPGRLRTARRIVTRFWKSYVSRAGFREGFYGVALAVFAALYPLFVYLKARESLARNPTRPSNQ